MFVMKGQHLVEFKSIDEAPRGFFLLLLPASTTSNSSGFGRRPKSTFHFALAKRFAWRKGVSCFLTSSWLLLRCTFLVGYLWEFSSQHSLQHFYAHKHTHEHTLLDAHRHGGPQAHGVVKLLFFLSLVYFFFCLQLFLCFLLSKWGLASFFNGCFFCFKISDSIYWLWLCFLFCVWI